MTEPLLKRQRAKPEPEAAATPAASPAARAQRAFAAAQAALDGGCSETAGGSAAPRAALRAALGERGGELPPGYRGGHKGAREGPLQSLFHAAQEGEVAQLCALLAPPHGVCPNSAEEKLKRESPLHKAAYNGHHEALDLLIVAGADLDATSTGWVILAPPSPPAAAATQSLRLTPPAQSGGTALHGASNYGRPICVERCEHKPKLPWDLLLPLALPLRLPGLTFLGKTTPWAHPSLDSSPGCCEL